MPIQQPKAGRVVWLLVVLFGPNLKVKNQINWFGLANGLSSKSIWPAIRYVYTPSVPISLSTF